MHLPLSLLQSWNQGFNILTFFTLRIETNCKGKHICTHKLPKIISSPILGNISGIPHLPEESLPLGTRNASPISGNGVCPSKKRAPLSDHKHKESEMSAIIFNGWAAGRPKPASVQFKDNGSQGFLTYGWWQKWTTKHYPHWHHLNAGVLEADEFGGQVKLI